MTDNGQLLNFVNGRWERSSAGHALDIKNPATASVLTQVPLSPGAEVEAAVKAGHTRLQELERDAGGRAHPAPLQVQGAAGREPRRHRPHDYQRVRQDLRRERGRNAARHRERRGGLRRADPDAGLQQRGHRPGHRRAHVPPAARRGGGDHAVQLPRHDPAVVHALCAGDGQLLHPQAERKGPDDLAEALRAAGEGGLPAGRRAVGQRRQGDGRRAARPPAGAGDQLCRLDAGGRSTSTAGPRPTASGRSARAGPRTRSS